MNNKAWAAYAENLMNGYQNPEVFKENTDWETIEFLDGFIYYERVVHATIVRRDVKVNSIKEE